MDTGLYDVVIAGAGPAGCACALALANRNLRVLLLDKATFPRDKVCGDAIPARAEQVLRAINPRHAQRLREFSEKVQIKGCRVVAPNASHFDFFFQTKGYCSKRLNFDHFLLGLVGEAQGVEFWQSCEVEGAERSGNLWEITLNGRPPLRSRTIVACDGAQSRLARALAGFEVDPEHHCAAVRAYYEGVEGVDEGLMEIHFIEERLPGYFWIFPVGNGVVNVGFGMLSEEVSKRRLSLRHSLEEIVADSPGLAERFEGARRIGPVKGLGLPMGSRKLPLSGEGFILCGDAAALVEPATGEGIGNAMLSGKLAAEELCGAFEMGDLSAGRLAEYDKALYGKIWGDLRKKYLAQKFLGERKWLMNWLVHRANRPGPIRWLMRKVF